MNTIINDRDVEGYYILPSGITIYGKTKVYKTYTEMIEDKYPGRFGWVLDASEDPTVDEGAAFYNRNEKGWQKLYESESIDSENFFSKEDGEFIESRLKGVENILQLLLDSGDADNRLNLSDILDYTAFEVYANNKYLPRTVKEDKEEGEEDPINEDLGGVIFEPIQESMTECFFLRTNCPPEHQNVIIDWGDGSTTTLRHSQIVYNGQTTIPQNTYYERKFLLTSDAQIQSDKTYYIKNPATSKLYCGTPGSRIIAKNVFYRWNGNKYVSTAVDDRLSLNEEYYLKNGSVYNRVRLDVGSDILADSFFDLQFTPTEDAVFIERKPYYIKDGDTYKAAPIVVVATPSDPKEWEYTVGHTYSQPGKYIVKIYGNTYYSFCHIRKDTSRNDQDFNNLTCRIFEEDLPIASHISNMAACFTTAHRLLNVVINKYAPVWERCSNFYQTFRFCSNLTTAVGFNYKNDMQADGCIFADCYNLSYTDYKLRCAYYYESTGSHSGRFANCYSLNVDVESLLPLNDFYGKIYLKTCFKNCRNLTGRVPAEKLWENPNATFIDYGDMFAGCPIEIRSQVPTSWGGTNEVIEAKLQAGYWKRSVDGALDEDFAELKDQLQVLDNNILE